MIRFIVFSEEVEYSITISKRSKDDFLSTIAAEGLNAVESDLHVDEAYIYGGVPRKRPAMPTEIEGQTLLNVRPGSLITINGQTYSCEHGGNVQLEFNQPGIYKVVVERWPYLDKEFIVENQAC